MKRFLEKSTRDLKFSREFCEESGGEENNILRN